MRSFFSLRLLLVLCFIWSSVTVYGQCPSVGGSVQGGATICEGQRAPLLRLQGHNGSVIRWERTINNGQTWLQITNTTINLDPGVITTTTCYRAVVRLGNCTPVRSLETCVRLNANNAVGGAVGESQTLCVGQAPRTLNLTGHVGTIVRWERSTDSLSWTTINNTSASFTPAPLSQTTWFRAVVESNGCPVRISTPVKLVVEAPTNPGEIAPMTIQACDVLNSGTLNLVNYNGTILRWEFSDDFGDNWTTIDNTTASLTYSDIPQGTRWYRAIVQSGGCAPHPSGISEITVNPPSVGGAISALDLPGDGEVELCIGQQQKKITLNLNGENGIVVRWEYINGDADWPTIPNSGDPERPEPGGIIDWTGTTYRLLQDGDIRTAPPSGNSLAGKSYQNGDFLGETIQIRAVVRSFACDEEYSEPIIIRVEKDCCTPPRIEDLYEISYDPDQVSEPWETLDLKINWIPGAGDPEEYEFAWRVKGGQFSGFSTTTDNASLLLNEEGGVTVLDNAGYDIIVRKVCEDVPGVDPTFSLSDTITCWVCTRVNPERISVDNVTDTTADITWFDQTSGAYYLVEWDIVPGEWVVIDTVRAQQNYTITGLTPQTQYRFRVTKLCFVNGVWVRDFNPTAVGTRIYNNVEFTTTGDFPDCNNFGKFNWAKTAGSGTGNDQGRAVTTDSEGYVYVLGGFKGNLQIGSYSLSSNSNVYDYYLAKYDPFGTPIWVKRIGSGSIAEFTESGNALTVDPSGNIYVTGRFYGSASFGNTTITSAGLGDIFVAKFRTTDGTHLWVKRAGGTLEDAGFGVELDGANNLYVVGKVTGSATFGDKSVSGPNTNSDLFIAKYSAQDGSVEWVRRAGNTITDDVARNVTTDHFGNAYVTGAVGGDQNQGDVRFGNNTITNNLDDPNAFIAKYDRNGSVNWVRNLPNAYSEGNGIALDPQGNVVIGGWYQGTVNFKNVPRTSTNEEFAIVPSIDYFVAKYEGVAGHEILFASGGGNRDDYVRGVDVDNRGGIYVSGHFASPTIGNGLNKIRGANSTSDIFVAKYNPNLTFKAGIVGGSEENDDRANGVTVSHNGAVYIVGDYKGTAEFSPENLTSSGNTWDAVVAQVSCEQIFTCPLVPKDVFVANIDNNTVSVNWVRENGVSSYDLRYRATNSQTWTNKTGISNPPYIIGNLFAGLQYEVQVRSNCAPGGAGTGPSLWGNPVPFNTHTVGVCGVPTSLDVDNTFNNELLIVWDRIPGAAYYEVQWRRINTANWDPAVRADSNMYLITGLESNVRYDIRVRSICSEKLSSPFSSIIRSTTNSGSCPIPTSITATNITPNSALITWTSAVTAFEYDVQWRKIGSNTWSVISTSATSAQVDFLENNTTYEYRVRSRCGATTNVSPYSDKQTFITNPTCVLPNSINVLSVMKREITLSWDAIAPGAKMYYVEYKKTTDNVFQVDSSMVNQITLKELDPGARYDIRLRVYCGNNNITDYSPILNVSTGTECDAPRLLEAFDITTTSMKVRWVGPTDAVGYKIEYKKVSEPNFNLPPLVIAVNEFNLTELKSGTEYDVRVTTICFDGTTSTYSAIVGKTLDCTPPANVRVRTGSLTTTSVVIEWDQVPGVVSYTVFWVDDNNVTNSSGGLNSMNRNFEITNLIENRKYNVYVSVDCGDGLSATSTTIEFTTNQTCSAPSNLIVIENQVTPTQAPVTWTQTPTATGYILYWKKNSDVGAEQQLNLDASADAYVLNELSPNTEYQVCVAARCGNEISPRSNCVIFKTKSAGTGCFTPTILLPITVFRNSATVRWAFVPEAQNYTISWRRFGSSQWTSTTISQTNFSILNLLCGTTYIVRVRARCPLGFTEWSEAQFTTLNCRLESETTASASYSVYPNPNNGNFNVRFNTEEEGQARVQLFDMQGKMVFDRNYNVTEGENNIDVATERLSAGIYTIRFILNGDAQSGRMTIIE